MRNGPSKWFTAFCLVFGIALGFGTAAVVMGFWSVFAQEDVHRGLFILVWMVAGIVFFAWPMQIVQRAHANKRQRQVMKERIGDLDYKPPNLPFLGTRAPGPKLEGIEIKAPDIGEPRLKRFFARGRTGEQRMADHLRSLELRAEIEQTKGHHTNPVSDQGESSA